MMQKNTRKNDLNPGSWTHYPVNTNMTGFRWFSKVWVLVLMTKVTSALEGLKQGLTLRFQVRGPKRYFDKITGQKQHFCIIIHTISGPIV